MRDLPSGEELARLAPELGGDAALSARCQAIARREESAGGDAFAAIRDALAARYGASDDQALLASLAAEIERGVFDAPGGARDWARRLLWDLTRQKLRLSNPDYLTAHGLD
jgi:hypothetical protein